MTHPAKINWYRNTEQRHPYGAVSPAPEWLEPIGFPPPWPDRPWIYGVMVSSANGVVAWKRKGPEDNPVLAILGIDLERPTPPRPEQLADKLHVLHLYTFGDVGVGAQTVREQPELVLTIREPGKEVAEFGRLDEALYRLRQERGLPVDPRQIIYSPSGRLELGHPIFSMPEVIVVTTDTGRRRLEESGARELGVKTIAEGEAELDREALIRAHERLYAEYGTRYLDCMGGETILTALRAAGILDEVFVTTTDVVIDEARHEGVKRIIDFAAEGAELVAEGTVGPESGWFFRRWRFNQR